MKNVSIRRVLGRSCVLVLPVLFFSGCVGIFGSTADMDMDTVGTPNDGTQITAKINKQDYPLDAGDSLVLVNTTQPSQGILGWPAPTCLVLSDYLGMGKVILVRAGYDTKAKNADGTDKYSEALINILTQMAKYELKLIRNGNTEVFKIELQDGILLSNLKEYRIRNGTRMSGPITLAQAFKAINDVKDRTLCFTNGRKVQFQVAAADVKDIVPDDTVVSEVENSPKEPIKTDIPQAEGGDAQPPAGPLPGSQPAAASEPKSGCSLANLGLPVSGFDLGLIPGLVAGLFGLRRFFGKK